MNSWKALGELPAETAESKAMSKELKRRGFRFVGPTVCYAFMQAAGLVERPRRRLLPLRRTVPIGQLDGGAILEGWRAARLEASLITQLFERLARLEERVDALSQPRRRLSGEVRSLRLRVDTMLLATIG